MEDFQTYLIRYEDKNSEECTLEKNGYSEEDVEDWFNLEHDLCEIISIEVIS